LLNDSHKLEDVLNGKYHITSNDVQARPETWTEEHLICKIIECLGLKKEPQPYGSGNVIICKIYSILLWKMKIALA